MLGKIDKYGHLHITKEGGISKKQRCKHHIDGSPCHDRCPLFGEVLTNVSDDGETIIGYQLMVCEKRMLFFPEFTDDRKGNA